MFKKGHKLNMGNKYCIGRVPWNKGIKHTDEMKKRLNTSGLKPRAKGWKHSEESKKKMSIVFTGRKNPKVTESNKKRIGILSPRWIANRTLLSKKTNKQCDSAYRDWRIQVYRRDEFKCKINNLDCKGRIEAHHILVWRDYPELRYDINNGITLCHFHHPRKREDEINLSPYFQKLVMNVK